MPSPTIIMLKQPVTFREVLIVVLLVAIGIVFFFRSCSSSDTLRTAALKKEDSLKALQTALQASHMADSLEKTALIGEVRELRISAQSSKDSAWMALSKLQKDYNGLSGRIVDNRPNKTETACPALYVAQCDSAATALEIGSKEVTRLRYKDSATKALYDYEINLRMLYETDLNRQYDSCQSLFSAQTKVVTALAKTGKQISSIWLGVEAQGSKTTIFQTVGAFATWQTRNGKAFSLGTGVQSIGGVYFTAKAAFKISFRK